MNKAYKPRARPDTGEATLSIEVTTRCNSHCRHCFANVGDSASSGLLADTVRAIIQEGYDSGYRRLHITGGEPMLWEGLFETLDAAFVIGYHNGFLNTNGTLLNKDSCRKLAGYHQLSVSVSLEGPEPIHDRLRGVGSYRRTIQGIENALDAGIRPIVFTTAGKPLLPGLPYFAQELYTRFPGIKYLTLIQLFCMTEDDWMLSAECLDPEEFIQLVQTVSLLNLCGFRAVIKNNPLSGVVSNLIGMLWAPQFHDMYRAGNMIIMANRDMKHTHSSRIRFGEYEPGMIEKVLNAHTYQNAVTPDETTCPLCRFRRLCRENGVIRPSSWYWNRLHADPYCKRVLNRIVQADNRDH